MNTTSIPPTPETPQEVPIDSFESGYGQDVAVFVVPHRPGLVVVQSTEHFWDDEGEEIVHSETVRVVLETADCNRMAVALYHAAYAAGGAK